MLKVIKSNIFLGKVCCNQLDFSNSRGAMAERDLFSSFPNRNKLNEIDHFNFFQVYTRNLFC